MLNTKMHHSRTPLYDMPIRAGGNSAAKDSCHIGGWLLWRMALILAGLLFLCGFAAAVAFLFQQRLIPASGSGAGSGGEFQVVASQLAASAAASGGGTGGERLQHRHRQRDVGDGDARQYLASDVSLLLNGSWNSRARFHPASFLLETEILNRTVHCDQPSERDISVVYSEPTWLCKNVRVGSRNATGGGAQQRLIQRLPFSDTTSRTLEEMMLSRQKELRGNSWSTSSDTCGQVPDRRVNVLLLCELLLAELRTRQLMSAGQSARAASRAAATAAPLASSVHIPYGNCSLPEEKRILLVGMATGDAVWYTEKNWKSGFVADLYCSF